MTRMTASSATRLLTLVLFASLLGGCGAWQTAKEATVNTTKAIFIASTLTLKLDLIAREGMNGDVKEQPNSVVVRIYQLKDAKGFETASYDTMLKDDTDQLKDNLLARKELVLRPGTIVSIDEPLDKETRTVGVTAFFRQDGKDLQWRITIPRDDLSDDTPLRLNFNGFALTRAVPEKK